MQLQDKKNLKKRKKKKEMKETLFEHNSSKISTTTNVPTFLGKKILHKMIDDGEPVCYVRGIVTEVLDDQEQDEECESTVNYDAYEDTFQVQLIKEWPENVIVKSKVPLDEPEKKKRKISAVPSSSS